MTATRGRPSGKFQPRVRLCQHVHPQLNHSCSNRVCDRESLACLKSVTQREKVRSSSVDMWEREKQSDHKPI